MHRVFLIMIVAFLLGGCSLETAFKDQTEAREYTLLCLQERYGKDFTIVGDEDYDEYGPLYGEVYTCKVAPKEMQEQIANVRVTQNGDFFDNWGMYYFKDEVENEVRENLSDSDKLQVKKVLLKPPETKMLWGEDEKEKYLLESGAYVSIVAVCEDELSDREYAELIFRFLEPVYQFDVNAEVSVKVGRTYIFFEEIQILGEEKTSPFSIEEIEETVHEMIEISPF